MNVPRRCPDREMHPAEAGQPVEGSLLNVRFGEGGHGGGHTSTGRRLGLDWSLVAKAL